MGETIVRENDLVALLLDLPEQGLRRGDVGTVIESFRENERHPAGYIVEFLTESGDVFAHTDIIDAAQIMPVRFRREAA